MEFHESDPTTSDEPDPWDTVTSEFSELKERLRETYNNVSDEGGPTEEEIKEALATLGAAWGQIAHSVTTALGDPVVREHLKEAAGSLASAIGVTITELGKELTNNPNGDE